MFPNFAQYIFGNNDCNASSGSHIGNNCINTETDNVVSKNKCDYLANASIQSDFQWIQLNH